MKMKLTMLLDLEPVEEENDADCWPDYPCPNCVAPVLEVEICLECGCEGLG